MCKPLWKLSESSVQGIHRAREPKAPQHGEQCSKRVPAQKQKEEVRAGELTQQGHPLTPGTATVLQLHLELSRRKPIYRTDIKSIYNTIHLLEEDNPAISMHALSRVSVSPLQ